LNEINFKNFGLKKVTNLVQVFPEVCKYSCSKSGERRNFGLLREYYVIRIKQKEFKVFESIKLICDHCGWNARIPTGFAKKAFKNGLKSNLLIEYSKNRIITSRALNFYASLWRVSLISFAILLSLSIIKFYTEPINKGNVKEISFEQAFTKDNLGKIVKISGKVDYTLALIKTSHLKGDPSKIVKEEVYMPLFPEDRQDEFIVMRGGSEDYSGVIARKDITNPEVLRGQNYTIVGKLELIDELQNPDLRRYFNEELPIKRNYKIPKLMISNSDLQSIAGFIRGLVPYYIVVLALFLSSLYVQYHIDKKILYFIVMDPITLNPELDLDLSSNDPVNKKNESKSRIDPRELEIKQSSGVQGVNADFSALNAIRESLRGISTESDNAKSNKSKKDTVEIPEENSSTEIAENSEAMKSTLNEINEFTFRNSGNIGVAKPLHDDDNLLDAVSVVSPVLKDSKELEAKAVDTSISSINNKALENRQTPVQQSQKGEDYTVLMIAALVLFSITLIAASYLLFKYFTS
jgi:hypothetical protein